MEPLELMEVLRPFLFRILVSGSVTPEKNGSLTLPRRSLAGVGGGGGREGGAVVVIVKFVVEGEVRRRGGGKGGGGGGGGGGGR